MGRQGEGGGLKILKIEETSFMDDPLLALVGNYSLKFTQPLDIKRALT